MAKVAPSATFHHTELGIKGSSLSTATLAQPLVGIRQTGFEDGNNIETNTDEGHTGVSNLDMGSYRTNAESAPTWEDGCRYGQGFEDYIYLLLGDVQTQANQTINTIYNHTFSMPSDVDAELPVATIYHGYQKTQTDARIFNNAMLNEFEFTMSDKDNPKVNVTFLSDYNNPNCINPTRHLLSDHLARTVKAQHTTVYVGAVGADETAMLNNPINCFTEASLSVNQNAESIACHSDDFGVNSKMMGSRELTGSISMPWLSNGADSVGTKFFEPEYECYNKYGHVVSTEITQKQIWYVCEGGNIIRTSTSNTLSTGETIVRTYKVDNTTTYDIATGIPFKTIFKIPVAEVTNVTSTKSGDEAKDMTFEWKGIEQPDQSYMTVEMVSDLSAMHIDTTGVTLSSRYPENSGITFPPA